MYRLACKVRLDGIRDQAFAAIRSGLNEENILQELSSSLTSKLVAFLRMSLCNAQRPCPPSGIPKFCNYT